MVGTGSFEAGPVWAQYSTALVSHCWVSNRSLIYIGYDHKPSGKSRSKNQAICFGTTFLNALWLGPAMRMFLLCFTAEQDSEELHQGLFETGDVSSWRLALRSGSTRPPSRSCERRAIYLRSLEVGMQTFGGSSSGVFFLTPQIQKPIEFWQRKFWVETDEPSAKSGCNRLSCRFTGSQPFFVITKSSG